MPFSSSGNGSTKLSSPLAPRVGKASGSASTLARAEDQGRLRDADHRRAASSGNSLSLFRLRRRRIAEIEKCGGASISLVDGWFQLHKRQVKQIGNVGRRIKIDTDRIRIVAWKNREKEIVNARRILPHD